MTEPTNVLYECVDQTYPDYRLRVVRANVGAHLTVSYKGKPFHEQEVPLSYGAPFGPDVCDIQDWGMIACEVTDKHRGSHAGD